MQLAGVQSSQGGVRTAKHGLYNQKHLRRRDGVADLVEQVRGQFGDAEGSGLRAQAVAQRHHHARSEEP